MTAVTVTLARSAEAEDQHHALVSALSARTRVAAAAAASPGRIIGGAGGPPPPLVLLSLLYLLVLSGAGAGVVAARLPSGHGLGRLAPGPSVEDDNPLPPSGQASAASAAQHQRRCSALPSRVLRQVLGPAFNPAYMAFALEERDRRGAAGGASGRGADRLDPRDPRGAADGPGGARGQQRVEPVRSRAEAGSPSRFAVDEDFSMVLSDEPAWQMSYEMPAVMLGADDGVAVDDGGGGGGGGAWARGGLHSYRFTAGRRVRSDADVNADADVDVGADVDADATEDSSRTARAAWGSVGTLSKDMQWHCESPLRWIDLGPDYFPRYLRSADCGHPSCTGAGFVCRPRSFSVKVLRRREGVCAPASDLLVEESTVGLPSDLRDLWVWELRAVNFCCVCSLRL